MSRLRHSFCPIHNSRPAPVFALVVLFLALSSPAHGTDWVYETGDLRGVWGSAANNVFAVGKRGIVFRYNGTSWKPVDTGFGDCSFGYKLKDIWGSSATEVYAVENPGKAEFGSGNEKMTIENRSGEDLRPPALYTGTEGAVEKDVFISMVQSFAQGKEIEGISICPGLQKFGSIRPKAGTLSEIRVALWEQ